MTTTKAKIFEDLERVTRFLSTPVYWLDTKNILIGANENFFKTLGIDPQKSIGKNLYDIVINTAQQSSHFVHAEPTHYHEEFVSDAITGKTRYFTSVKNPLHDDDGNIVGIVGTSIEVTSQKEAEQLRLTNERLEFENKIHKIFQDEQTKFKKVVDQVSHDIRSPLASILIFAKSTKHLPEDDRILLRDAATRITDIANNLSVHYIDSNVATLTDKDIREPILVSAAITQILSEKRLQYRDLPVKFEHEFTQDGNFAFINIEDNAFKRMLSNLINNSVDAFEHRPGYVDIYLECGNNNVKIIIQDNGKGMSQSVIHKIKNNIIVTEGKVDGSGIGLTQVRETLQRNEGKLEIDSTVGQGTSMILTFPQIPSPESFADNILLNDDDLVIVLDDDTSIHGAWEARFANEASEITLKHFLSGVEAVNYINNLTPEEKQKIFLLSDFELLDQEVHGLQVIEQTGIQRSILVTSHHNNKDVREMASKTSTKILPKSLAVDVPIKINKSATKTLIDNTTDFVDLVIVDDDRRLAESLKLAFFSDCMVDIWVNPDEFINNYTKYPLDTKICLDNNFPGFDLNGIKLAEELHGAGYTRLYLISGDTFDKSELPSYLNFILKTDIDSIELLKE